MAKFIRCSCENTTYDGKVQSNPPVNIELVTFVEKKQLDTGYGGTRNSIKFGGVDVEWTYGEKEVEDRNQAYQRIINNDFSNPEVKNYMCLCNANAVYYKDSERNECRECGKRYR